MSKKRWHILKDDTGGVTISRCLPPRFDLVATTILPAGDPVRIGQQVRQDMWRALKALKGFQPVVEVRQVGNQCIVRAGGRVVGAFPEKLAVERISEVLEHPANRIRWIRFARRA